MGFIFRQFNLSVARRPRTSHAAPSAQRAQAAPVLSAQRAEMLDQVGLADQGRLAAEQALEQRAAARRDRSALVREPRVIWPMSRQELWM